MTKKEALATYRHFYWIVKRVADATGADRHFRELEAAIREEEAGHVRFGTRLLGQRPRRAATRDQIVHLFVTRTIIDALDRVERLSQPMSKRPSRIDAVSELAYVLSLRRDFQLALSIVLCGDGKRRTMVALLVKLGEDGFLKTARAASEEWSYREIVDPAAAAEKARRAA